MNRYELPLKGGNGSMFKDHGKSKKPALTVREMEMRAWEFAHLIADNKSEDKANDKAQESKKSVPDEEEKS